MKNRDWAEFKRLLELCCADRQFIREFYQEPEKKLKEAGLSLEPQAAYQAVVIQMGSREYNPDDNYYIKLFRQIVDNVYQIIDKRRSEDYFANQQFKHWFDRQNRRVLFECSVNRRKLKHNNIPVTFELTDGCSGGCAFCCLQPAKLKDSFAYEGDHPQLWRDILARTEAVLGRIAGTGICYFATEPFDNPDYEDFISDFYNYYGFYPQTTTVKAADYPQRIKKYMKTLGAEHLKYAALRFSVVSKKQLEEIYRQYTIEELAYVELLLNNPESINSYSLAGRALKLEQVLPDKGFTADATSVCTVGFVVNMAKRTVTLAAPRKADPSHPLGMTLYEVMNFTDGSSYEKVLLGMISKWMPQKVPLDRPIDLGSVITYKREGSLIRITGDRIHRTISMDETCYKCFCLVTEKKYSILAAFDYLAISAVNRDRIIEKMQILYDAGYLML